MKEKEALKTQGKKARGKSNKKGGMEEKRKKKENNTKRK